MSEAEWKTRLRAGIEASGKSHREISQAAGVGDSYVNNLLNGTKDPTIGNLLAVCEAAKLSIYKVLGDFDITPQTEEFLRLLVNADEATRRSILQLLQAGRKHEAIEVPDSSSQNQPAPTPK